VKESETQLQSLRVRLKRQQHSYDIRIGSQLRRQTGDFLRKLTGSQTRRIAIISNKPVFRLYGREVTSSLQQSDFTVVTWLMPEGERFKSVRSLEGALAFLAKNGLERTDAVLALGGGVVGDLAGFAAATYLRGVALIQMPTTLLSQIDSSVGGKTGVNLTQGKNLVGAFHQPSAVVIDTETLATLPSRELVSGFCEAIKQGAVASHQLFRQTVSLLEKLQKDRSILESKEMEELIAAQCRFKASVVVNDERESTSRTDRRSRRILNFGHTAGHALEAVTSYRRFRHGEAVGHGMLVAGALSKNLGLLPPAGLELLRRAVRLCGSLPDASNLDEKSIIEAVARDKKSLGGQVKWILLERIGSPRIIDGSQISRQLLRLSLREGLRKVKE
jgi:3-dehydroquinate synthase